MGLKEILNDQDLKGRNRYTGPGDAWKDVIEDLTPEGASDNDQISIRDAVRCLAGGLTADKLFGKETTDELIQKIRERLDQQAE